jgi:hypothetical protein
MFIIILAEEENRINADDCHGRENDCDRTHLWRDRQGAEGANSLTWEATLRQKDRVWSRY